MQYHVAKAALFYHIGVEDIGLNGVDLDSHRFDESLTN
jgi:hypothetical protein